MPSAGARRDPSERAVRVRAGWISLAAGVAIFAGKLGAYALTGSTAVLSDAMESVVNVVAATLLVYSLVVAARPADRDHPYGHGKVEFFSAGVEGALIAVAAALIFWQSVRELLAGPQLQQLDLGIALVTVLTAANAGLGAWLLRLGQRTRSLALEADGRHLLTDVVTSSGVVAALLAVWVTGWQWLDPLAAMAVALHILRTGWQLLRRAVGGLMDEADVESLRDIVASLERDREPWCIDVHSLRTFRSGAAAHVDLHVAVPRYFDVEQLHEIDAALGDLILETVGKGSDVIVHFDPCRPRQCPGCSMPACPVRAAPFAARDPLSVEQATRGDELLDSGVPVTEAFG